MFVSKTFATAGFVMRSGAPLVGGADGGVPGGGAAPGGGGGVPGGGGGGGVPGGGGGAVEMCKVFLHSVVKFAPDKFAPSKL